MLWVNLAVLKEATVAFCLYQNSSIHALLPPPFPNFGTVLNLLEERVVLMNFRKNHLCGHVPPSQLQSDLVLRLLIRVGMQTAADACWW